MERSAAWHRVSIRSGVAVVGASCDRGIARLTLTVVVHITTVHSGSDSRIYYKECCSLAGAGYQVVLMAPSAPAEVGDGIAYVELPSFSSRLARMTIGSWRAFRYASALPGDVYHLHDPELLPVGRLLRLLGRVVVFDMHEDLPKALLTKHWLPAGIRHAMAAIARVVERVLLHGIPVIFAEYSYAKSRGYVAKYAVILNTPRLELVPRKAPAGGGPPSIAYIGGVSVERGALITLDALRRLRDRGLHVVWRCVGSIDGPGAEEIRSKAAELGPKAVILLGRLPPREAWRQIAGSRVGLAILQASPNYVESFPTKMFEYMALGIPVVASDFPAYRGIVEGAGCGICVNPADAVAVADAIESILRAPDMADRMSAAGRAAVEGEYSWSREEQKLLAFYATLGAEK